MATKPFKAKIGKIGINPYVFVPPAVLEKLFIQAGKDKGPLPVKGTIDGHAFIQTLVKYSGAWRLYLNAPMRVAAGKDVGHIVTVELEYDHEERTVPMHPKLEAALKQNKKAGEIFNSLAPHLQKEIRRYISSLKTEESIERNVKRAIMFLLGKERFIGRDKP